MISAGFIAGGDEETTTTETKIPEMSEKEEEIMAQGSAMVEEYMRQAGYDMVTTTTPKNPGLITEYEKQIAEIDSQIAAAGNQTTTNQFGVTTAVGANPMAINQLEAQKRELSEKLATESANVTTVTTTELNETGRKLETIRNEAIDNQAEINRGIMDNARKFLNGDYSITPSQKQYIEDSVKAMREPVFAMLDEVSKEAERTGASINDELTKYTDVIKETGISVGAALNAVSASIDDERTALGETKTSVYDALNGVKTEIENTNGVAGQEMEKLFTIRKTLAARDMDETYKRMRSENAVRAAQLGRSQYDPEFQAQLQDQLMKNIETTQLKLSEQEALMKYDLVTNTGQRKEQVELLRAQEAEALGLRGEGLAAKDTGVSTTRAQLAAEQGAKLEDVAGMRTGVAERTGAVKEGVAQSKAAAEASNQAWANNMRWELGANMPAKAAGMGIDVGSYQNALAQQSLANTQTGSQIGLPYAELYLRNRMAQPTTTTTTSGSVLGSVMGTLGTLGGIAGNVMGGVGGMMGQSAGGSSTPQASGSLVQNDTSGSMGLRLPNYDPWHFNRS